MMLITTLVVSFCKDGGVSVSVKLWFLVEYVRCEVLFRLVVAGNVFSVNINSCETLYVYLYLPFVLSWHIHRATFTFSTIRQLVTSPPDLFKLLTPNVNYSGLFNKYRY